MWIKPLRSMVGTYGQVRRGVPANIDKHLADQLVAKGLAVPHVKKADDDKGGDVKPNPPKAAPRGGKTGAKKPSQSSPEGQA